MTFKNAKLIKTIQILLGLILIFFGLNGFFQFYPLPEMGEAGTAFIGALFNTGYIFPIINVLFILVGLMFLFNKCVAFGSILIFPITLNIALFHIFLEFNSSATAGFVIFILNIYLMYVHFDSYRGMCNK